MPNVYEYCPKFESDKFLLRFVEIRRGKAFDNFNYRCVTYGKDRVFTKVARKI